MTVACSDNVTGADNQQGRPDSNLCNYIAGFVDGEGSFHVAIQMNPSTKLKWQIVPEFHVSQHAASRNVLDLMCHAFDCGYVKPNHRLNSKDETFVFVVRSRLDLANKVIPFFREYSLRTSKKDDFEIFSKIVSRMQEGEHKNRNGLIELLKMAFSMNRSGRYRRMSLKEILQNLEPSETARQISLD